MKELYSVAGITKQALWKHRKYQELTVFQTAQVINAIEKKRKDHRKMGVRSLFYMVKEESPVGRDIFERIGLSNGFRIKRTRSIIKTTWSQRVEYYPNLIEGKILTGINQVWQSDMFYIMSQGEIFYGVTIIDVYSRKLLSLHISKSLSAKSLEIAMKKALKQRAGHNLTGCIFHSDRGGQYISKSHKLILSQNKMVISMCVLPQENAYAERVQGTLKNDYIVFENLREDNMTYVSSKIMRLYNNEKPHLGLKRMTPKDFEDYVDKLPQSDRPKMPIYQWNRELLTKSQLINKKKKVAKKKKSTTIIVNLK
jgi:transposase InsO family protein